MLPNPWGGDIGDPPISNLPWIIEVVKGGYAVRQSKDGICQNRRQGRRLAILTGKGEENTFDVSQVTMSGTVKPGAPFT